MVGIETPTFREFCKNFLIAGMMSEQDANSVMELFVQDEGQKSMLGKWDDPITGYPRPIQNVCTWSLKRFTTKWIEENCPQAFYKPMFDGTADKMAEQINAHEIPDDMFK